MIKNRDEIIFEMKNMADEKYRVFHSGLCPGTFNILGVRIPKLREYAKKLSKENWRENYNLLTDEYYEEIMLQGMMIGLADIDIEERLEYLEKFIPKIDNWAVCDVTCVGLKFINKNKDIVWKFIQKYLKSTKEFELRFAIVVLLDYYIDDEYIDDVINILDKTNCTTYYVKMAVAWTISVIYVKYPDKCLKYLKSSNINLDDSTYNQSIQKIIESNRVSKKDKENLRKLKKKNKKENVGV